jgi:hypothetical protein
MRYLPVLFLALLVLTMGLVGGGCLSGCGGSQPSHSDYLGYIAPARWEEKTILWRVYGGPPNPLGSEVRRAVNRGLGGWSSALPSGVEFREAQSGESEQVAIRFVKVGGLSGKALGYTTTVGGAVISSASVEIDSVLWANFRELSRIAAHEGGHALGIRGHSPYWSDLMFDVPRVQTPSRADVNTIRACFDGGDGNE